MFSKQNTFGASSSGTGFGTFGTTNNTTSPFGQSFTKPAATFGQPSAFGTQNTGLFGTPQTSTGLFNTGTTNTFGSTAAAQPTFGGFNQPQTSNTLFGTPQQNTQPTLFGQNNTNAFGAQPKPAFGFNQNQPSNSIFGQTTAASSSFGSFGTQNQNTSVFGSAGTAFGQTNQTANAGTSIAKYQPSIGTDTLIKNGQPNNVSTKQHCITAMKEYENKSIEELRFEDYLANRKGTQGGSNIFGQPSGSTGLFGTNTQQGTGLFGQTTDNKSVFGTANTLGTGSAFGQNTATTFGQNQNTGGLFSKPFTSGTNTFGGFGSTDNTFGAKPAFNQPGGTNLFGQNPIQTSTGFGQTPGFNTFGQGNTQPSLFGNTTTDNKGAFGLSSATSNTGFSGFGNNSTTTSGAGLFGKPTGFGTNTGFSNPTSTSAFGASTFGANTNASLFNAGGMNKVPSTGFGGFGTSQAGATLGGGLNTANTGQSSLFSNTKPGGLFGNNTLGGGSIFGTNNLLSNTNTLPTFNSGLTNTSSFLGGQTQQQASVPVHQQILAMSTLPYGENPIIKDMKLSNNFDLEILKPTNPTAQKAILENSMNNFKVQSKFSSGIKTKSVADSLTKKSLFDGLESFDNSLADNFKLKNNAKRLIIKPKTEHNQSLTSDLHNKENLQVHREKSLEITNVVNETSPDKNLTSSFSETKKNSSKRDSWLNATYLDISQNNQKSYTKSDLNSDETIDNSSLLNDERNNSANRSENIESAEELNDDRPSNPAGVILNRVGYYMIPSIDELESYMDEYGNCVVPTLTIGRERYGNVFFNQPIDITNMNFDEIVHIRYKQITIYPDDDCKPPEGQGLNREAQVTLDQVWPVDKTLHEPIKDVDRLKEMNYEGKLRNVCYKQNMRFLEYNPETGSWVFKVKHFSKYGLTDTDEEDDAVPDTKKLKTNKDIENPKTIITLQKKETNQDEQKEKSLKPKSVQENGGLVSSPNWNMSFNTSHKEPATDTHKLQLMKASFFVDSNMETESVVSEKSYETTDRFLSKKIFDQDFSPQHDKYNGTNFEFHPPSTKLHEIFQKRNVEEPEIDISIKQEDLRLKPKIAANKINSNEIILESSILLKDEGKCLADVALMTGYRFKVSFNTLNMFMAPTRNDVIINGEENKKKVHNSIKMINCFEVNYHKFIMEDKCIIPHLEIYLDHAVREEVELSDCPHLKCGGDLELLQLHVNVSNKKNEFHKIWKLCLALWGNHEELEGYDVASHHVNMSRRSLLSNWFEEQTQSKKSAKDIDNLNRSEVILEKLYTHQVNEAANLAFENDEPFQALLISQISSGEDVRQLIQHQLATWEQFEIDEHIDNNILKIFMLLSGTQVMSTKNGPVDVLENLEWLNVVAVHLWYLLLPTSSIMDVINTYDKIFKSDDFLVVPPKPDHINYDLYKHFKDIFDIKYHLLQLYSKRNYSVENIVNPLTYSSDLLDCSISWLILQILEVIGYTHCSELNLEKLHLAFAAQLENYGFWTWAVFVLLHINNRDKREMSIQQLLYRNIELKPKQKYTDDEKFIINRLGVPEKWINWTKALRAGIQRNYKLQTDLFLKAEQWHSAYKVLMRHVVPDAIINENFQYICDCLSEIDNKFKIPNWSNEGHIILSFINICTQLTMSKLIHKKDMKSKWNSLNPIISEICSRLNHFPCPTSKHKLCQSEMAQKLTCLIRTFLLTWQDDNTNKILKMTLGMLPLPQEFLQQELRFLFANITANA
ncbi:nuclear pore complex protein Nup98-Nup96 [Condylostylus longicornis]|uniref:nuclear pore complex protein Nup98-Nup96 n=1 Tax=Condylostylus longicornis TaxID=2530218 RepID=UPI00244E176E|nr:nuclear pore complex protein Nup98-Nup96 [Condylostylus longicornis]